MTATDAFYVRGHAPVPEIDPPPGGCGCTALVERELELSLATLREAFREREVTATLQCAGNRRAGLIAIRDIPGEAPWGPGATGTATWTGVALADVLALARPLRGRGARRLRRRRRVPGGPARPALRRLDPARQGVPPRGAARLGDERRAAAAGPRRTAARGRARLHRRAQRQVARADRAALAAVAGLLPARRLPAAARGRDAWAGRGDAARARSRSTPTCCHPADGATVAAGPVEVRGYAFAGGERYVARVDVSTRRRRDLVAGRAARRSRAAGPGASGGSRSTSAPGEHEIVVRAWDSSAATQPEDEAALWNPKGYVNNARPRIRVTAVAG